MSLSGFVPTLVAIFAEIKPAGLPDGKIELTLPSVLKMVLIIAAMLSVLFVTIGGFKYVVSNGDPQGTAKAKNTIISAIVGLLIAVFAYAIIGFVTGSL